MSVALSLEETAGHSPVFHRVETLNQRNVHCQREISGYENYILACVPITSVNVYFYSMHSNIHYLYNDAYAASRYHSGGGRREDEGGLGEKTGRGIR